MDVQLKGKRLFLLTLSSISLLILSLQAVRQSPSESFDQAIFVLSILTGLVIFFSTLGKSRGNESPTIIPGLSVISILLGVYGIEKHTNIDQKFLSTLWLGFGWPVLIFLLLLIPFVFTIYSNAWPKTVKLISSIIALTVVVVVLPLAGIQGGRSIIDTYHSEYVINEMLAVPSGNIPYVDFIPQYGILYTWLLAPFTSFFNPDQLVTLGLYMMSLGGIAAVLVGVWLVYKATNKHSLALASLLVVPITVIAKFPDREDFPSTIFSLLSAVPVRLLYGILMGWLLIKILSSVTSRYLYILLGLSNGIGVWLNQDFLIASALVSTTLILVVERDSLKKISFLVSLTVGVLLYPIALSLTGRDFRFDGIGFFALQYTSGFMAEAIQTPGPVLVILPLVVALFFASNYTLYQERFGKTAIPDQYRRAILTASFFSSWSLIGFAYYLNRSYASGQMQILFLPLSIAMASYFYYILPKSQEELPWNAKSFFAPATWRDKSLKKTLANLPIALVMALPLATTIALPSPTIELERLTNAPPQNRWPNLPLSESLKNFSKLESMDFDKSEIAFLGNSGNYFELLTGVESLNILNSPWDLPQAEVPLRTGCDFIEQKNPQYIIADSIGANFGKLFQNGLLCGAYVVVSVDAFGEWLWTRR